MKNKKIKTALIFIVLASVFGGSVPVASKYGLEVFKPFTMVVLRFFIASIFLLPLVIKSKELNIKKFKELFPVALVGALNPILLFIALQFTKASFSPLIYASVPALTAIYSAVVLKKKLNKMEILGILIGLFGVGIIVLLPYLESHTFELSLLGNILIFGASIAFLFYGILSKKKQRDSSISPLALTFYFSVVTFLVSLPFASFEVYKYGISSDINIMHILSAIYVGLFGTGVFYLSYQYALKNGSTLTASLFTYLQPVFGIILASVFLGEPVTLVLILGGTLAVIGASVVSQSKSLKKP
jgi:drug/metabolite transporter (DMT)-like permease